MVTAVAGRREHLERQRVGLRTGSLVPDLHVVAAMGEPDLAPAIADPLLPTAVTDVRMPPAGLPVAAARNAGAVVAMSDHCDVLVFLDVDVIPDRLLVQRYVEALATVDRPTILCGPVAYLPDGVTDPAEFGRHPFHRARPVPADGEMIPLDELGLFWSLSFALHRDTWRSTHGFDEDYVGYGAEDTDFAHRAHEAGIELAWLGGAAGYHQYHPISDPPVEHLDDILVNGARFAARWGTWPMTGWLEAFEARGLVRRDTDGGWVKR